MSGEIRYTSACGACGPAVQARVSCTGEFGDEWGYDSYGSCGDCSYDCVSFGLLGNACTVGTRAKCKHLSYLGDKASCCMGKGPGSNTKNTCNPSYNISNPECDSTYATYCAKDDKIIRDPICINWRNIRPEQSRQILQSYCLDHMEAPECRQWCTTLSEKGDGTCDQAMQAWCNKFPQSLPCTCIKSPLADPKYGINPKCNDRACIDTGYLTANMRSTNCPDITNCDVQTKMLNSGVQLAGVVINQSCGKSGDTSNATKSLDTTGSGSVGSDGSGIVAGAGDYTYIMLLVLVFVLFIAIAVLIAFAWGSDDAGPSSPTL